MGAKIRKKSFRKKIKKPDEFLLISNRILAYMRGNVKTIIAVSLVLVLLILSTGLFIRHLTTQKAEFFNRTFEDIMLANSNFKDKQYDKSEKLFKKVIQGTDASSFFNEISQVGLGYTYMDKGEFDKSIKLLEDLIAKNNLQYPKEELYKNLAVSYKKIGNEDMAAEIYKKLAISYPDSEILIPGIAK